ncbi:hypothetical protein ACGFIF_42045 [Kribbella sp. NPDC049174]|uniref:hypothetical protein n=1 Tax=Kribbella sp. NPDC049174 TaxID=3364112 RepID=UPI003718F08A
MSVIVDDDRGDRAGVTPLKIDCHLRRLGINRIPNQFDNRSNGVRLSRKSLDQIIACFEHEIRHGKD